MTLEDLKKIPVLQTRAIATDAEDEATQKYLSECVFKLWAGDFGKVPQEDTEANLAELEEGEGRILARYDQLHALENDIYIISYFSASMEGLDYNHTMIMYVNEY